MTLSLEDSLVAVSDEALRRTGKRPSPATVWRWIRRGCRGARLEAVQLGGRWFTTTAAFDAFVMAQTAAALASYDAAAQSAERSAETAQRLRDAGLLP